MTLGLDGWGGANVRSHKVGLSSQRLSPSFNLFFFSIISNLKKL